MKVIQLAMDNELSPQSDQYIYLQHVEKVICPNIRLDKRYTACEPLFGSHLEPLRLHKVHHGLADQYETPKTDGKGPKSTTVRVR